MNNNGKNHSTSNSSSNCNCNLLLQVSTMFPRSTMIKAFFAPWTAGSSASGRVLYVFIGLYRVIKRYVMYDYGLQVGSYGVIQG